MRLGVAYRHVHAPPPPPPVLFCQSDGGAFIAATSVGTKSDAVCEMYFRMGTGGAAATVTAMTAYGRDEPEDLSTSKRATDSQAGGGKPTDHSIATIMKCSTGTDSCDADDGTMCVGRKKQRVEDIVHSIYPRLPGAGHGSASAGAGAAADWRRRKNTRKQVQPQQHGAIDGGSAAPQLVPAAGLSPSTELGDAETDGDVGSRFDDDDLNFTADAAAPAGDDDDDEKATLRRQLRAVEEQLRELRQRFRELRDRQDGVGDAALTADVSPCASGSGASILVGGGAASLPDWERLLALVRSEIKSAVSKAVASSMEKFAAAAGLPAAAIPADEVCGGAATEVRQSSSPPQGLKAALGAFRLPIGDVNCNRHGSASTDAADELSIDARLTMHSQKERRKRTKVTDTRLSPRAARVLMAEVKPVESDLHVAAYAAQLLGLRDGLPPAYRVSTRGDGGGLSACSTASNDDDEVAGGDGCDVIRLRQPQVDSSGDDDDGDDCSDVHARLQTTTLTPLHLRKAKLMFFYVRYPSSALLKAYFPDVRFNKNNTAQLVKWFSNFREFYYIQMEKYARQLATEGQTADDISVTLDSELYKILNLHYNRSNQIEVPRSFRAVVQSTLKEFVRAISLGRDQEQSWKKPIYKVIMRMDDSVPDFFKSVKWMEQLTD